MAPAEPASPWIRIAIQLTTSHAANSAAPPVATSPVLPYRWPLPPRLEALGGQGHCRRAANLPSHGGGTPGEGEGAPWGPGGWWMGMCPGGTSDD